MVSGFVHIIKERQNEQWEELLPCFIEPLSLPFCVAFVSMWLGGLLIVNIDIMLVKNHRIFI